jgi:hypothetical protein
VVYEKLRLKVPTAIAWNYALSSKTGTARMTDKRVTTGNRLTPDGPLEVQLVTGRYFCASEGIEHIDFMKIDAEGHDLEVLKGFDLSIVDFIQAEASANPHMRQSVPFFDIYDYLTSRGFYLFGIYDQAWEFKQGPMVLQRVLNNSMTIGPILPVLRRIDPVFIHGRLVGPIEAQEL